MQAQIDSSETKLQAWLTAQAELLKTELALRKAMIEYGKSRSDPPRQLIIVAERQREQVRQLFEIAIEALDAVSVIRTGHTDFGGLH